MGPYEPMRARMGPARALEEREKFRKNAPVFFQTTVQKIAVFDLHMTFFDSFNVFFRFLANASERL